MARASRIPSWPPRCPHCQPHTQVLPPPRSPRTTAWGGGTGRQGRALLGHGEPWGLAAGLGGQPLPRCCSWCSSMDVGFSRLAASINLWSFSFATSPFYLKLLNAVGRLMALQFPPHLPQEDIKERMLWKEPSELSCIKIVIQPAPSISGKPRTACIPTPLLLPQHRASNPPTCGTGSILLKAVSFTLPHEHCVCLPIARQTRPSHAASLQ